MLAKRKFLALVLIGSSIASAACSLITDVDRSKIEGSGGGSSAGASSGPDAGGASTGGHAATTGGSKNDAAAADEDAGDGG
jgi:hypothetical protein